VETLTDGKVTADGTRVVPKKGKEAFRKDGGNSGGTASGPFWPTIRSKHNESTSGGSRSREHLGVGLAPGADKPERLTEGGEDTQILLRTKSFFGEFSKENPKVTTSKRVRARETGGAAKKTILTGSVRRQSRTSNGRS